MYPDCSSTQICLIHAARVFLELTQLDVCVVQFSIWAIEMKAGQHKRIAQMKAEQHKFLSKIIVEQIKRLTQITDGQHRRLAQRKSWKTKTSSPNENLDNTNILPK
jgi:hypothetical protein